MVFSQRSPLLSFTGAKFLDKTSPMKAGDEIFHILWCSGHCIYELGVRALLLLEFQSGEAPLYILHVFKAATYYITRDQARSGGGE